MCGLSTAAELLRLYNSGLSLKMIESQVGIPRETVRLRLHKAGAQMRHVHPIYSLPRLGLDVDTALMLGLHAGDGWISGRWGISINSKDRNMVEDVIKLAKKVLGVEPGVSTNRDNTTTVWSYKKQVVEFFLRYGFPEGKKSAIVEVPRVIYSSGPEIKIAFLKGLFSADGCFYKEGRRGECRLEVASKSLRDGFVSLASEFGFEFRCYTYFHHGGHNKLPLHTAYLGKQPQVMRWMKEVGSLCDSHRRRFRRLVRLLGSTRYGNPFDIRRDDAVAGVAEPGQKRL